VIERTDFDECTASSGGQIDQVSAEDHAGQSLLKMLYMQHTHTHFTHPIYIHFIK